MLSFLARHPPRTRVAHLDQITYDDGLSIVTFKSPSDRYLVVNLLPPDSPPSEAVTSVARNSVLTPPLHWHVRQNEIFHVLQGTARFEKDGQITTVDEGQTVSIPKGCFHKFCNASAEQPLLIEFVLEPKMRSRDEAYFRNIQTYRDDCRKVGFPGSFLQVLCFMRRGGVVLAVPGPKPIAKLIGLLLNFWGGLMLGKWILGYKGTYSEYFNAESA